MVPIPVREEGYRAGRRFVFALVAGLLLGLAALAGQGLYRGADAAHAASDPVWVDDMGYGSGGGGYYWDFTSNQAWTRERGWHQWRPVVIQVIVVPCWVNFMAYGSASGGFYLDPRTGLVWTAERGWHHFDPRPPRDRDHDGIPDPFDRCPDQPGPAGNNGCPLPKPCDPPIPGPATAYGGQGPQCRGVTAQVTVDRGEGATYQAGDPITVCYRLLSVQMGPAPMPFHFRITRVSQGGQQAVVFEGDDNGQGGGDCFTTHVGLPSPDRRTLLLETWAPNDGPLATDTTWFAVGMQGGCPSLGPATVQGCPAAYNATVTVDRGEGSTYQVGDAARICYHVDPVGRPFHFRITRITAGSQQAIVAEGDDNGTGGGDCLLAEVGPPAPDTRTLKLDVFVGGALVASDTTWFYVGTHVPQV